MARSGELVWFLLGVVVGYFYLVNGVRALRKHILVPLLVCMVIALQGCVSLVSQNKTAFGDEECSFPLYTYGGALNSIGLIGVTLVEIPKKPAVAFGLVLVVVDFPFTVALDTITLPISVVRDLVACTKKSKEKVSPDSKLLELATDQGVKVYVVQLIRSNKQVVFYLEGRT